ncbi:MAG: nitroreductase family deazaflavin-dependent oxidoreductase [Deltaproteobacteria bacterium]|nr:nitroreductase family deazaflavin-dependent oxidoreductase [Deltaproteobacteria bacterium]
MSLKLSGERWMVSSALSGLPVIVLISTGAKTRQPRRNPLIAVPDPIHPERFALIASNWGQTRLPAWYHNLKQHPRAHCIRQGQRQEYRAQEASGEEYAEIWRRACSLYGGYSKYKSRVGNRPIPIMVMTPTQS